MPLLFEPSTAFKLNIMMHYGLAEFFTFLYARQIGMGIFASLAAGTIFSLLGYLPSYLQHVMLLPAVWIPLILYFVERLRQNLDGKHACFVALAVAHQVLAGNLQVCFYTYIVLFLYFLFLLFRMHPPGRLRFSLLAVIALTTGWLIALPQLMATYELSQLSRITHLAAYEFFSSFAFPLYMLPTFLFPFF